MARGEMVRYLAEHNAQAPEDAQSFDRMDYRFSPERSTGTRIAPVVVEAVAKGGLKPRAQLQAVGDYTVKGAQNAVQAGEDAHMVLNIVELRLGEQAGGHVLVLDAVIAQYGRGARGGPALSSTPFWRASAAITSLR